MASGRNWHRSFQDKMKDNIYVVFLFLYVGLITYIPSFEAVDANATKFFTLSILNLVGFALLIISKPSAYSKQPTVRLLDTGFFWLYLAFTVWMLVTIFFSFSLSESFLQMAKWSGIFGGLFLVSHLMHRVAELDKLLFRLALYLTALLCVDAISVIYTIWGQILDGKVTVSNISFIYSNKNILASAIFVKLPFAVWLLFSKRTPVVVLAVIAIVLGSLATFMLETRAFYLGLISSVFFLMFVATFQYFKTKKHTLVTKTLGYATIVIVSVLLFNAIESFYYPNKQATETSVLINRLSSIQDSETGSAAKRLDAWKWSLQLIKNQPLFGVGPGNWKIEVLRYENQLNPTYDYMYKAHNDYIEATAELGLIGGVLYLSLFLWVLKVFLAYFKRDLELVERDTQFLFLSTLGIVYYSFDALFNFPADRPEIQVLLILYWAIGLSTVSRNKHLPVFLQRISAKLKNYQLVFILLGFVVSCVSASLLYLNFKSHQLQKIAFSDISKNNIQEPSVTFVGNFPPFPQISAWGESLPVVTSYFLFQENKYEEVITLLRNDRSNPYDAMREHIMAKSFDKLGLKDSALFYAELSRTLKPYSFANLYLLFSLYEATGNQEAISPILDDYLIKQEKRRNAVAWAYAIQFYSKRGQFDKSDSLLKLAAIKYPENKIINQVKEAIALDQVAPEDKNVYDRAFEAYTSGAYSVALPLFTNYINRVPNDARAYKFRAFCYFKASNLGLSLKDTDTYLTLEQADAEIMNLRGVIFANLNQIDKACEALSVSSSMGNQEGKNNYAVLCSQ
jgi:O-antigen ligase